MLPIYHFKGICAKSQPPFQTPPQCGLKAEMQGEYAFAGEGEGVLRDRMATRPFVVTSFKVIWDFLTTVLTVAEAISWLGGCNRRELMNLNLF